MKKILSLIAAAMFFLAGCAIFQPIKPEEALTHPLGTDSLKIGMTKEQVRSLLGEPDSVMPLEKSKDLLSTDREEWVYRSRYSNQPLNADYFGKNMHLTFDGNNLTSYKNTE
jgi:hypothetical protein